MGKGIEIQTNVERITPGETLTVPIIVELEKRTKVRFIKALFHAAERSEAQYTTTSTDAKGAQTTTTHTATEDADIVKEEFLFVGEPPAGCFAGIGEFFASLVGAGKGVYMDAGRYEYSTQFTVPADAPPSMKGENCSIFYELSAQVSLPLRFDLTGKHAFTIGSPERSSGGQPVVARYPDEKGRGFWDRTFGKDAELTLALHNSSFAPGEPIKALFQAETNTPIKIKSAEARLVCIESTRAKGHSTVFTHTSEPLTIAGAQEIHGGFSTEFVLDASFETLQSKKSKKFDASPPSTLSKNFEVEWFIEVKLDVPWAVDPTIRAPIWMLASE